MRPLRLADAAPAFESSAGAAVLAKGFRPFFLLGALYASLAVPLWALVLRGTMRLDGYLDATSWHAHEMVFGFATAIVAGFLLTAVANWTQRETATGPALLALALLWVAGRIALLSSLPHWLIAATDLAFLPAIAIVIGRPIVLARNHRNVVMLVVLLALWLANVTIHLDALGALPGWRRRGAVVGIDVLAVLMVVIAGRVVPMFTRNVLHDAAIRSHPRADVLAAVAVAVVAVLDVLPAPPPIAMFVACTLGCVAVLARTVHWGTRRAFRDPLLWILHVGHAWISVGLGLRAFAAAGGSAPQSLGTHAITVGAIGALTLGMMARVGLGHTGRRLVVPRGVSIAFVLVTAAAVLRVATPLVAPDLYLRSLMLVAVLWAVAFGIYVVAYAPVLVTPRIDGKPG